MAAGASAGISSSAAAAASSSDAAAGSSPPSHPATCPGAFASDSSTNEKSQASKKKEQQQGVSDVASVGVSLAPASATTNTTSSSTKKPPPDAATENESEKNKSNPGPSLASGTGQPEAEEKTRRRRADVDEENCTTVNSDDDDDQEEEQERVGAHRIEGSGYNLQNQRPQVSSEGLIELEAQLVEEEETKPPPVFADATPAVEPSKLRKYGPYGIILVLIVVVGTLVAVFVPRGGSSSGSDDMELSPATTSTSSPTSNPTSTPTAAPTSGTFAEMLAFAQTKSSNSSLSDPSSPQYKAVEWLAQDKVENGSNWNEYELLQRYVLRVFYHSTGGETWGGYAHDADTTWFNASSVCEWGSINAQCNGNGQEVDLIDFGYDNLQGTIPEELGLLTALTFLGLYENRLLTGGIPTQLGLLTALKELYLWTNQLTGTVPTQLAQLTVLAHLDFDENQLTGTIPVELRQLTALTELWLSNNQLTSTIPPQLGELTALTRLDLDGNQLTGTIPTALTQLTNLEELYFHNNNLTGQVPSGFCAAPFPDWKADGVSENLLAADCISQVECDCCDACVDERSNEFCWNGNAYTSRACS